MAASRIQRWSLLHSSYEYEIEYRPGSKLANADALSRLPLPETTHISSKDGSVELLIHQLSKVIVTANQIKIGQKRIQSYLEFIVLYHTGGQALLTMRISTILTSEMNLASPRDVSYGDHE